MLFIQMTGLSGAGKSSIARLTVDKLMKKGHAASVIDGDEFRKTLCADLGFSRADRMENIRRLGSLGIELAQTGMISLLAAINPYEEARASLKKIYPTTLTVFIDCPLETVIARDPKGLYRKALLQEGDPGYLPAFTGISDPFEKPENPDLVLHTANASCEACAEELTLFILKNIQHPNE